MTPIMCNVEIFNYIFTNNYFSVISNTSDAFKNDPQNEIIKENDSSEGMFIDYMYIYK